MISYSSYAFALQLVPGLLLGAGVLLWYAGQTGDLARRRVVAWLDVVLVGGVAALGAGRLQAVLLEWDYFSSYPADVFNIWYGGFGWQAMVLGGIPAVWLAAGWRGIDVARFTDGLALVLPLVMSATWWACRSAGCAYGVDAPANTSPWLSGFLPDAFGVAEERFELQVLGALLSLAIFLVMVWLTLSERLPARRLGLSLVLMGALMFMLGFWRADPVTAWGGLRVDQWLDLVVVAAAAGFVGQETRKLRRIRAL